VSSLDKAQRKCAIASASLSIA